MNKDIWPYSCNLRTQEWEGHAEVTAASLPPLSHGIFNFLFHVLFLYYIFSKSHVVQLLLLLLFKIHVTNDACHDAFVVLTQGHWQMQLGPFLD